jgi:cytokinesis protein
MQLYLEEMMKSYNDIMVFYGEDPTDENARRDFFAKLAAFMAEWKKSREKNIQLEETRKRNEASMKRKNERLKQASVLENGASLPSPTSTGAMDSLLEKLRAAAPQTRDQRDRRRRARLKDRHQVRIASGQQIPDLNEIPEVEAGLQSAKSTESGPADDKEGLLSPTKSDLASPKEAEEDDVAERAALLLQGMRAGGQGELNDEEKRESLRKSRRQTADEERRMRRRRRERATDKPTEDRADGSGEGKDESVVEATDGPSIIIEEPSMVEDGPPAEAEAAKDGNGGANDGH